METTSANDYAYISQAIHYLEENARSQPSLDELAAHLHLSPFHLQRMFKRWAGISPKRFVQFLTLNHAKQLLDESKSLLDTTYEVGLSSASRLHDLFVNIEAMTPAEYKKLGAGLTIHYGFHKTPFGDCLLAATQRGICALLFVAEEPNGRALAYQSLQEKWAEATLIEEPTQTAPLVQQIFFVHGVNQANGREKLTLLLKGTNFQLKVWEALLRVPPTAVATYGSIAKMVGKPKASRAVGTAIGRNGVGYLIPCHRVIRQSGVIDGYRWGSTRKKAILAWESAGDGDGAEEVYPINT